MPYLGQAPAAQPDYYGLQSIGGYPTRKKRQFNEVTQTLDSQVITVINYGLPSGGGGGNVVQPVNPGGGVAPIAPIVPVNNNVQSAGLYGSNNGRKD